jgi:hypothetical protein
MNKIGFFFCFLIFLFPGSLIAATDDFFIKVLVGEDVLPPSTPALLTVVPIAPTQIDIDWSAATDNLLLGGYVLSRDGIAVATTTLTSFMDTGLLPETLYSYTVYAFDSVGNISTTSNALATTTLALPPPVATSTPVVENSAGSATLTVVLKDFILTTSYNAATLVWETNRSSRYGLRWGRTDAYNGGYIVNEAYQTQHQTTITDLEPGTVYVYELIGYSPAGIAVTLKRGQFTTEAAVVPTVVPNVTRLRAEVIGNDVSLTWQLPETTTPAKVRVVRNHLGYPTDSSDGAVVYEGTDTEVFEKGVLQQYSQQYYTVFVIESEGTVSSGAVVVAKRADTEEIEGGSTSTSTIPEEEEEELLIFGLDANNISISQAGKNFTFLSEEIELLETDQFTISLPYDAVPKYLKAIIVTLLDPTDQRRSYSFLLRINKEGTAYEATVAPLGVLGVSRLQVEIFDFERKIVGRYRKQITFAEAKVVLLPVIFPDALLKPLQQGLPGVVGILTPAAFGFLFFWLRSRKTEDNQ